MSDVETRTLSEISVKVGRLEVMQETNIKAINDMASSVNRLVEKLDKSDDIAREADQRARSSHHRIDEVKTALEKKIDENKLESDKKTADVKDDIKWLWRTVLGAVIVAGIAGAGALVWKIIGGVH